jgi:DUF438 domain-containing protein
VPDLLFFAGNGQLERTGVQMVEKIDKSSWSTILDQIPVGITLTDINGQILYYNKYSSEVVDRKPEYIGKDIRHCHQKQTSIDKIVVVLSEIKNGQRQDYYYESKRGGKTLAVTISPVRVDGKMIGFIQSFVVKRNLVR